MSNSGESGRSRTRFRDEAEQDSGLIPTRSGLVVNAVRGLLVAQFSYAAQRSLRAGIPSGIPSSEWRVIEEASGNGQAVENAKGLHVDSEAGPLTLQAPRPIGQPGAGQSSSDWKCVTTQFARSR